MQREQQKWAAEEENEEGEQKQSLCEMQLDPKRKDDGGTEEHRSMSDGFLSKYPMIFERNYTDT